MSVVLWVHVAWERLCFLFLSLVVYCVIQQPYCNVIFFVYVHTFDAISYNRCGWIPDQTICFSVKSLICPLKQSHALVHLSSAHTESLPPILPTSLPRTIQQTERIDQIM